jgi:hypothetical protein
MRFLGVAIPVVISTQKEQDERNGDELLGEELCNEMGLFGIYSEQESHKKSH